MRRRRARRAFFSRPTVRVARSLLGAEFTVRDGDGERSVRLVETEAYVAGDPASHAYRGPTPRNRSMFLVPGTLYVYRIHQVVCANLVTRSGEAVLLRAGEPVRGIEGSTSGPGRLCRGLGIRLTDDGADVVRSPRFSVWLRGRPRGRIRAGPRVGVSRARARPLRFMIAESRFLSRPRRGAARARSRPTGASPRSSRVGGAWRRSRTTRRRPSGGGRSGYRIGGR